MIFFTGKQLEWCALFYPLGQISYVANSGLYVKLTFPPYITATTGNKFYSSPLKLVVNVLK
jgi:hypothetical protein